MCDAGANVDKLCQDGGSAMMTAVQFNQIEIVKALKARGARMDVEYDGDCILDLAGW